MRSKVITFRCPVDTLNQLNALAKHFKRSRNTLVLAAMNLFSRQLNEAGMAEDEPMSADLLTPEQMFPHPESRGGRPRKVKPEPKAAE